VSFEQSARPPTAPACICAMLRNHTLRMIVLDRSHMIGTFVARAKAITKRLGHFSRANECSARELATMTLPT
jgi:hypothetical protein